jgi:hypothetical protein
MLSGVLLFGVGCAGTGGALRTGEAPIRMNQDTDEPLLLANGAITGPSSSLNLSENGMNGRFRNLPVELQWSYQELSGNIGQRKTRLELAEGDDTRIWGHFATLPVDLVLAGPQLYGYVGACVYVMQQTAEGFEGKRDCGLGTQEGVALGFPAPLQQRALGEKAALLTLTFANDSEAHTPANPMGRMTTLRNAANRTAIDRRYENRYR